MRPRVVIVDGEKQILDLVTDNLRNQGFEVESFLTGNEGLAYLQHGSADLLLLDTMLPDGDGFEICRRLRADERFRSLRVIFVTANDQEIDRVVGLELGADDYVLKPFSPRELVARVKAVLRRRSPPEEKPPIVDAGQLHLDVRTQEVTVRGRPVELSKLEFRLLHFLASHPRMIFNRDHLLDEVWGRERSVTQRTVDVHIRRLREKIEAQASAPHMIQTVRGSGYRFVPESSEAPHQ